MTLNGSSPNLSTSLDFTIAGGGTTGTDIHYMNLSSRASISLNSQPAENESSCIAVKYGNGSTVQYNFHYLDSGGSWARTDADNSTSRLMIGYALGTDPDVDGVAVQGVVYQEDHGFSIGEPIFLSTSTGQGSNNPPTGVNDYVRIVGYALSNDAIYFDPDKTWVKVA